MSKSNKKTILFHPYMALRVQDLVNLAIKIKDEFNIFFLVPDETYTSILVENDIDFVCLHCKDSKYFEEKSFSQKLIRNKFSNKFLNFIKPLSLGQLVWQQLFYNDYKHYYKICSKIIEVFNVDLLVTINDRFYYPIEMALLKLCKERKIPIVIPYIMNYNPDVSVSMLNGNKKYMLTDESSYIQKKVFSKYKSQSYKNLYFLPPFLFLALEKFGTLSKIPWVNGGGLSNIVVMANKLGYDLHKNMGIQQSKLKILGDISLEQVYDTYINKNIVKSKIIKNYNLNHDKKIMVIGLVNWWEHGLSTKEEHFNIMFHTIESCLKYKNDYNILLVLHPSMLIDNYKFLEKKYDIQIAKENTTMIVPISDLYVINYSSTIVWSLLCSIKTIIVGYHKKMDTYERFTSIATVTEKNQLDKKLKTLINKDVDFSNDHALLSKEDVFDNKISVRYKYLFNELIKTARN